MSDSLEFQSLDLVGSALAEQEKARSARESFVEYLKFCGKNREGEPLRLDNESLRGAKAFEDAYFGWKDFCDEEFRGSTKSTKGVYAHAWMLGRDPRLSIGHFSCRNDEAWRRNEWLQDVLKQPEHVAVFGKEATPIESLCNRSETSIHGNPRPKSNPNVRAAGIEAARASDHVHRLWADDVVDEKNSLVEAAKLQVIKNKWALTVRPMLISRVMCRAELKVQGGGCTYYSGTPYAEDDLHADQVRSAKRGATLSYDGGPHSFVWESPSAVYRQLLCGGEDEQFFSPCPAIIGADELREIWERNPRAFDMAYRLIAVGAGEKPFVKIHYWLHENWKIHKALVESCGYIPAKLPRSEFNHGTHTWHRILVVDPGFTEGRGASYTGYVVGTLGSDNRIYILYADQFRKRWDEGREILLAAAREWKVDEIWIEAAAQQSALLSYFRDNKVPYVDGISPNNAAKFRRAMDVSGDVNGGTVVLPGEVTAFGGKQTLGPPAKTTSAGNVRELVSQMKAFPGIEFCDLMDALVYCVQKLRERFAPRAAKPKQESVMGTYASRVLSQFFGVNAQRKPNGRPEWDVFIQ